MTRHRVVAAGWRGRGGCAAVARPFGAIPARRRPNRRDPTA